MLTMNGRKIAVPYGDITNVMDSDHTTSELPRGPTPSKSHNQPNYSALLAAAEVRPTDDIPKPPVALVIENEGRQSIVGTLGNFSTLIGKAKVGKTFAVSIAIAAAVALTLILNRIKGTLPIGQQGVLFFDTEQSRYHVLRVVKRICTLSGLSEPTNLKIYSLRAHSPDERLALIDYAIHHTPNIGLVVIDGIRDLAVDPVLDADQASRIITHLLRWTDQLNIHVLTVLHQNKTDANARGHIGTELIHKSETVFSVAKDGDNKDVTIVAPEFCRDKDFEPFAFSVDEQGIPYLVESDETYSGAGSSNKSSKSKGVEVESLTPETIREIVERAFAQNVQLSFGNLRTNIMEASQFVGASLSEKKANEFIRRIEMSSIVVKVRPDKARWDFYQLNLDAE